MGLTEREWKVWNEIQEWENHLHMEELTDFTKVYDKWLERLINDFSKEARDTFFLNMENGLFHLHAFIQNSNNHQEARSKILGMARIFDERIQNINDLNGLSIDQLTYIADHQIVKHRLASLAHGGLTGTGNPLALSTDLLGIAVINLRAIQLIALSFGFGSRSPFDMMLSLKVFYAATLPKRYQKHGWKMLMEELNEYDSFYLYAGNEKFTDEKWLEQPAKHILKSLLILFSQKKFSKIPIAGVAIGAGANYKLTKQVTEFAKRFYQFRFLFQKKEEYYEYSRT